MSFVREILEDNLNWTYFRKTSFELPGKKKEHQNNKGKTTYKLIQHQISQSLNDKSFDSYVHV